MKVTSTITQLGVHSTITQKGVGSSIAESGVSHTPPVFVSAEIGNVDNNILVITYDIEIDPFSVPANEDYSITLSGGAINITDVQILSDGEGRFYKVEITLSRLVEPGETGTFSYTGTAIRSQADNEGIAANFTDVEIINNVVGSTPVFVSAVVENATPTKVVLTYNQTLDESSVPATTDFTLAGKTISSVVISGATVEITVAERYFYGDTISISYTAGANPIQGDIGEIDADNLVNQSVTNNVTVTAITANSDMVEVGGYPTVISSGGTVLTGKAVRYFINKSNTGRIRANATITQIKLYIGNLSTITSFYFQVVRKNGSLYDVVAEEDILSKLSAPAINTVTLTTPIAVLEGDFVAIGESAGGTVSNLYQSVTSVQAHATKYQDVSKPGDSYDWDSKTSLAYRIPLKVYGNAPMTVCIGDSIVSGSPANDSFITDTLLHDKLNSFPGQLEVINALYNPQNMGYPSQTTTQILARFTADCIDLKPKIAILEGGVNDINGGVITKATFLSNWTSMLDACETAGIIPVVCKILPWTNGSNTQMQTRDDWMTDLEALVATYTGSVWVDFDSDIGKFRAGGDDGNLWDIQTDPDYDYDGVHLTLAGYTKMAEVINTAIVEKYYLQ